MLLQMMPGTSRSFLFDSALQQLSLLSLHENKAKTELLTAHDKLIQNTFLLFEVFGVSNPRLVTFAKIQSN